MQSLPHGEFDVIVVEPWSEVDGAEEPLLLLLELLTLSEPADVNITHCFICSWVKGQHVEVQGQMWGQVKDDMLRCLLPRSD